MLRRFSIYDLIVIAVMAAVGIAIKPVVASLAHVISTPLMIPGGSLAGGLYMLWIVLAYAFTGKIGAATLTGLVQAVMVIFTGIPGSHGIMSFVSYTAPGLAIDILMVLLLRVAGREFDRLASFLAGMLANITGTFFVNIVFFHLPAVFLTLTLAVAALSGGVGGLIAWELFRVVRRYRLIRRSE